MAVSSSKAELPNWNQKIWSLKSFGQLPCDNPDKTDTHNSSLLPETGKAGFNSAADIEQIAIGISHSLVLTKDGRLYVQGQGEQGQLGLGPQVSSKAAPHLLSSELFGNQPIVSIV